MRERANFAKSQTFITKLSAPARIALTILFCIHLNNHHESLHSTFTVVILFRSSSTVKEAPFR